MIVTDFVMDALFCSLDVGTGFLKKHFIHFGLFSGNVQTEILHPRKAMKMIGTRNEEIRQRG